MLLGRVKTHVIDMQKEARSAPITHLHMTYESLVKSAQRKLEDVVFTEVDTRWVHYPHSDALVITARVAHSNVHKMLVDNKIVVDIIYLDAYKIGLIESELRPPTSPLYGFTGDHVIPKRTIKLIVTTGEHSRVSTVMTEFLIVDCPSAFNGVIGKSLLKVLKAVASIYHLTMKFSIAEGTGQVRESQYD